MEPATAIHLIIVAIGLWFIRAAAKKRSEGK